MKPNKSTVRLFYDILHGISSFVGLRDALELGVLIGFDGQLKQNSKTEETIFYDLISQLHEAGMKEHTTNSP